MSNSSPTIQERISHRAKIEAYANARHLGYRPMEAALEASMVGAFVDQISEIVASSPLIYRGSEV